jgi:hypothetical protein
MPHHWVTTVLVFLYLFPYPETVELKFELSPLFSIGGKILPYSLHILGSIKGNKLRKHQGKLS